MWKLKWSYAVAVALALLGIMGCSDGDWEYRIPTHPLELVESDLKVLSEEKFEGLSYLDPDIRNRFAQVYGGTTAVDIHSFFRKNLRHFLYANDIVMLPRESKFKGWLEIPAPPKPGGVAVAFNIGLEAWLRGLVDETTISIRKLSDDRDLYVSDHSSGIVAVTNAYTDVMYLEDDSYIEFFPSYRLGVLAHEGRHSQCTGGVTQDEIQTMRLAKSYEDFRTKLPDFSCGHFHSMCPASAGNLAGYPACDDKPWGAYMMDWLYAKAKFADPSLSQAEKQQMNAMMISSKLRFQNFNVDLLVSDPKAKPDMTGAGVVVR